MTVRLLPGLPPGPLAGRRLAGGDRVQHAGDVGGRLAPEPREAEPNIGEANSDRGPTLEPVRHHRGRPEFNNAATASTIDGAPVSRTCR